MIVFLAVVLAPIVAVWIVGEIGLARLVPTRDLDALERATYGLEA